MAEIYITGALNTTPCEALDAVLYIQPIRQVGKIISTLTAVRLRDFYSWVDSSTGHSAILKEWLAC